MNIIYFDESKYQRNSQNFYILCGILFPYEKILDIEKRMDQLAVETFGSSDRDKHTEFHAWQLINGNGNFSFLKEDDRSRIDIYKKILDILKDYELDLIRVVIDPAKLKPRFKKENINQWALLFLIEKSEQLLRKRDSYALLVGDRDKQYEEIHMAAFHDYKNGRSPKIKYTQITRLMDTLYFTDSKYCRYIQITDIYTYTVSMVANQRKNKLSVGIIEYFQSLNLFPAAYRDYP